MIDRRRRGKIGAGLLVLFAFGAGLALAASGALDRQQVSAADFTAFLKKTGSKEKLVTDSPDAPAVNVTWYQAKAYCEAQGKRLPTEKEWMSACEAKSLVFRWSIWEWTSDEVRGRERGSGTPYKVLCGVGPACECAHAYPPGWKSPVKGFRCAKKSPNVRREGGAEVVRREVVRREARRYILTCPAAKPDTAKKGDR
ncbi:MAG: SUMF1/EgtB/PvdO family nonheme iron enzyme [bacterium]|nr:SUMF1/EgtB/PvdO family nonheme iron enzyme [bacterium]